MSNTWPAGVQHLASRCATTAAERGALLVANTVLTAERGCAGSAAAEASCLNRGRAAFQGSGDPGETNDIGNVRALPLARTCCPAGSSGDKAAMDGAQPSGVGGTRKTCAHLLIFIVAVPGVRGLDAREDIVVVESCDGRQERTRATSLRRIDLVRPAAPKHPRLRRLGLASIAFR